jgi:hypothetical protein
MNAIYCFCFPGNNALFSRPRIETEFWHWNYNSVYDQPFTVWVVINLMFPRSLQYSFLTFGVHNYPTTPYIFIANKSSSPLVFGPICPLGFIPVRSIHSDNYTFVTSLPAALIQYEDHLYNISSIHCIHIRFRMTRSSRRMRISSCFSRASSKRSELWWGRQQYYHLYFVE